MAKNCTFTGRAFCSLDADNPEFDNDMRGAYVSIVCRTTDIQEAIRAIASELSENAMTLRGFDYLFDIDYLDRNTSDYEDNLISKLDSHPVQFKNVHFFKADS